MSCPRSERRRRAASEESLAAPQAFVSLNWLLTEDSLDLETELAFGFLNYLLLGTSASPLYKVRLRSAVSGTGSFLVVGGISPFWRRRMRRGAQGGVGFDCSSLWP